MMLEFDKLTDDCCFLCGVRLNGDNQSPEHVFPKWLLKEANLWNKTAWLWNATSLPYRQCVIPCCDGCNTGPLSNLESEVKNAFRDGVESVRGLDPIRLSLWMAKIYYGFLRRGIHLPTDRANPSGGPIVPAVGMQLLSTLHLFLQRIRFDHQFAFDVDSTFVCTVHDNHQPSEDFYWMAATLIGKPGRERFVPALAIRHKGIGVISAFGDGGSLKQFRSAPFEEFRGLQLHRIQFFELACRTFYQHSLFTDRIQYQTFGGQGNPQVTIAQIPSDGPVWHEWDQEEFAAYFFRRLKEISYPSISSLSDVYVDGHVVSFLYWPDGRRRVASAEELG